MKGCLVKAAKHLRGSRYRFNSLKETYKTMNKQKTEVARSFSYKLNIGNYQTADFFCSQKAEVLEEEAEKKSEELYAFCRKEVLKSINSYLKERDVKPLDEKNANIAGPAYGVYMTGPSGQNLPHLIIQSGGASQASVMLRSQMIVNEIAGFHNTSDATSCIAYMNEIGETLNIDCNTTTTGADLIVSDDMQVVGDVWIKDTDGQWHFMTRELNLQDELRNNLLLGKAGIDLVGTNLTITDSDNLGIAIIINRTETLKDQISDSVTIVEGTNTTPVMNTITYQGSSNPILTRSTSTPAGDYANVARMLLGSDENPYASIGGRSGLDE